MTGEEPTDELVEIVDPSDLRTLSWEPCHVMSPRFAERVELERMSARFWLQADATPCARGCIGRTTASCPPISSTCTASISEARASAAAGIFDD
jgi:hypothetical protein